MHNAELRTRFAVEPGYQAVELPYGNGELSMLALVPDGGRLEEFERGLDAARLAQIDTAMRKASSTSFCRDGRRTSTSIGRDSS